MRISWNRLFCCMAVISLLALPALAQPTVLPGIDAFETSSTVPSVADFSANPIPAGFFCTGSAPYTGKVTFQGSPLVTDPPGILGTADTVVERLDSIDFANGDNSAMIVIRALNLFSNDIVNVFCPGQGDTRWRVSACLCECQDATKIVADMECDTCGRFYGELAVNVCLTFTNIQTGEVRGPVSHPVSLAIDGMGFCTEASPSDLVVSEPFKVDTDCNGRADLVVAGMSNFFPGRSCDTSGVDCWTAFAHLTSCHSSFGTAPHDHCINPVCGKRN